MKKEVLYSDFDLPTKHLGEGRHFVPAKARDEDEIERRRGLPKGALLAEHQERGVAIASTIIKLVNRPADITFATGVLSAAGLNTAWYSFARGAEDEVMRRRLKLPFLAAHQPELRLNTDDLMQEAAFSFSESRITAQEVLANIGFDSNRVERLQKTFGRRIGKASLTLACAELGNTTVNPVVNKYAVQGLVRHRCLQALQSARKLDSVVGLPPSIAQLADPDSHLSVYWRREAPNEAAQAYSRATELHL